MSMKISVWSLTDKGLKRESNQDSFIADQDLSLYIVADGMGGHSGGEIASSLAVEAMKNFIRENRTKAEDPKSLLTLAYRFANQSIQQRAKVEPRLNGMGTTMVAAFVVEDKLFIGNVGDSRAYLFRKGFLWQLTEDHSLMNEQLRAGLISEAQIENYQGKNVITRSVGYENEVQVDLLEREVQKGDHILMCSDGLCGLVEDQVIEEILKKENGDKAVQACVKKALENGGDDNVTVLLLEVR